MFYYLYEVKNNLNGKIYVGVHKTRNLNDGYMGSGKVINRAIKKHGVENFTKVILEMFDDSASMYAREKELITDEFLSRTEVYNLRRGGSGGFDHINKIGKNKNHPAGIKHKVPGCNGHIGAEVLRALHKEGRIPHRNFLGKQHSEKTKMKMRRSSQHLAGEKNSQFGSMWITDGTENRKIKKYTTIPDGWYKGRIIPL